MISMSDFNNVVTMLREEIGDVFVIGVDMAASLWNLTNVFEYPITILTTEQLTINTPNVEVLIVPSLDENDIVERNGVRCTTVERTLVDLLRYERNPQVVCEALSYYYYNNTFGETDSWKDFPRIAEEEGVLEEFESYIDDAIDYLLY